VGRKSRHLMAGSGLLSSSGMATPGAYMSIGSYAPDDPNSAITQMAGDLKLLCGSTSMTLSDTATTSTDPPEPEVPEGGWSEGNDAFTKLRKPRKVCKGNPLYFCCAPCREVFYIADRESGLWWQDHSACMFRSDDPRRWNEPVLTLTRVIPEGFEQGSDISPVEALAGMGKLLPFDAVSGHGPPEEPEKTEDPGSIYMNRAALYPTPPPVRFEPDLTEIIAETLKHKLMTRAVKQFEKAAVIDPEIVTTLTGYYKTSV